MRRSRGVLLPPLGVARPRRGDLYRALRTTIVDGILAPGARLPSTRHAAADYGVSRGLVEEVFGQLADEGFLERTVGRGTFVARSVTALHKPRPSSGQRRPRRPSRRGQSEVDRAACREPAIVRPFNGGIADSSEFPWPIWCRFQHRATRELGRRALDFSDPRGLPQLRAAIARHLAQARGIRCESSQVVIFNSSQQALIALSLLLLNPGDQAWLEDPCYLGARTALELASGHVVPVPLDDEGLRPAIGIKRAPDARLVYVTPSSQYPTGAMLSLTRRIALLDWAAQHDAWIIEDDYDGDFRYEGQPITPLYALDARARVLYVGSLSKPMFVALRLAFAIVPDEFVEALADIRTQLDAFTTPILQMTMSMFMEDGHFSAHLRRMRGIYAAKRATLVDAIAPLRTKGWTWSTNPAGMHLLLRHGNGKYVRATAAASGLDVALLSRYRTIRATGDGLLLRFAALNREQLRAGADALVSAAGTSAS